MPFLGHPVHTYSLEVTSRCFAENVTYARYSGVLWIMLTVTVYLRQEAVEQRRIRLCVYLAGVLSGSAGSDGSSSSSGLKVIA